MDRLPAFHCTQRDYLPVEVEHAVVDLLDWETRFLLALEPLKHELRVQEDFTAQKGFNAIDRYSSGFIDADNLRNFLASQGAFLSNHELSRIIRRLDTDCDGLINFVEWCDFIRSEIRAPVHVHHSHSPARHSPEHHLRHGHSHHSLHRPSPHHSPAHCIHPYPRHSSSPVARRVPSPTLHRTQSSPHCQRKFVACSQRDTADEILDQHHMERHH